MANKKCLNCGDEQYITIDADYYIASFFSFLIFQPFIFYKILGQSDRVLDLLSLLILIVIGSRYVSIEHKPKKWWLNSSWGKSLNYKIFFPMLVWINGVLISLAYIYKFLYY